MDCHHRLVQHVRETDPALAFSPLLKAVKQVNQVAVFIRVAQFLKHYFGRRQGGFYEIDEPCCCLYKIFLVAPDLISQIFRRQPPC